MFLCTLHPSVHHTHRRLHVCPQQELEDTQSLGIVTPGHSMTGRMLRAKNMGKGLTSWGAGDELLALRKFCARLCGRIRYFLGQACPVSHTAREVRL